jgi:arsenite-transporting ATPase
VSASQTRIVLHTGKGGVGKTTISAITALAAARNGRRVLVLSTDPAHSLADVLGCPVGSEPTPVPGTAGLLAAQVDTMARYEQAWSAVREYLVGVLAARGMADVQAEELLALPGAEDVIALLEVARYADRDDVDVVVVDCAPSGDTLRLLALPETIEFYAGRLMGTPTRLLRTVAASLAGVSTPPAPVRDAAGELLADLARVREMLADTATTAVRLVLTPEAVVLAEARRLRTALALHGFAVEAALVNRVLPDRAGGAFLDGWRRSQRAVMAQIEESFGDLAVPRVPMTAGEPVGVPALTALATAAFGDTDPLAGGRPSAGMSVTSQRGGYRLILPLPHADRSGLSLARSGDELVITLGDRRRRVALPSVLRRCTATGARFAGQPSGAASAGTTLVIDFAPDPERWPAALAGSLPATGGAAAPKPGNGEPADGRAATGGRHSPADVPGETVAAAR